MVFLTVTGNCREEEAHCSVWKLMNISTVRSNRILAKLHTMILWTLCYKLLACHHAPPSSPSEPVVADFEVIDYRRDAERSCRRAWRNWNYYN